MVTEKDMAGIYINVGNHGSLILKSYHSKGQPCPVAVSFGHHPLLFIPTSSSIPWKISEYAYTGAMQGEPLEVVRGPLTGLPIPARSEIAIEGEIPVDERRDEGPFGEYTGYYASGGGQREFIKVNALYYRNSPIILGAPSLRPPAGNAYWASIFMSANIQAALKKADVSGAIVWVEPSSARTIFIVSLKQRYAGHARQAGHIALNCGAAGSLNRYVIVVDDDIDLSNLEEVVWALAYRSDPINSIDIIKHGRGNMLDPFLEEGGIPETSKAVIDACIPFGRRRSWPMVNAISEDLKNKLIDKWSAQLDSAS